jgi:hypothetical protein
MTLTIQLSPEAEKILLERAAQSGQTLEGFVLALLEREAQTAATGPGLQTNHFTPELRQWLCRQVNEAETVADLRELRDQGGPELQDFLPDLEQVVHGGE